MENKIISIISGKGGVGKTTFVSNLILALSSKFKKKVLVLDMDIGNLFFSFGLTKDHFKTDIIDVLEDESKLADALYLYKKNLYFLGLKNKNDLKNYTNEAFLSFINKLKNKFDYILLDVGAGMNENFIKSIYVSDASIVVIESTYLSYKISERIIEKTKTINSKSKNFLVLNKHDVELSKKGILLKKEDIVSKFTIPLIGVVPYNIKNISYLNIGIPFYLTKEDTTFYEIYNDIGARLITKLNI